MQRRSVCDKVDRRAICCPRTQPRHPFLIPSLPTRLSPPFLPRPRDCGRAPHTTREKNNQHGGRGRSSCGGRRLFLTALGENGGAQGKERFLNARPPLPPPTSLMGAPIGSGIRAWSTARLPPLPSPLTISLFCFCLLCFAFIPTRSLLFIFSSVARLRPRPLLFFVLYRRSGRVGCSVRSRFLCLWGRLLLLSRSAFSLSIK